MVQASQEHPLREGEREKKRKEKKSDKEKRESSLIFVLRMPIRLSFLSLNFSLEPSKHAWTPVGIGGATLNVSNNSK